MKQRWGRMMAVGGLLLLLIVFGVWLVLRSLFQASLPPREGSLRVQGVEEPVEIHFDGRGIPQIYARSDADAFFALGWLHASDRLFQMEMIRRLAQGRLSELLGPSTLELDRHMRRLSLHHLARQCPPLSSLRQPLLDAYVGGINEKISHAAVLPFEFYLLGTRPAPWTAVDVISVAMYQTWFSHELMDKDKRYRTLKERLGEEVIPLWQSIEEWAPPTVPLAHPLAEAFVRPFWQLSHSSNSWVLSPAKSRSGHALHAADPHLEIQRFPSLWYAAGLHSEEGLSVLGVTAPGVPFVAMGHNGEIAWSFTVGAVDIIDYFQFSLEGDQLSAGSLTLPLSRREEKILVKGQEAQTLEVLWSAWGPVMDASEPGEATVCRWPGFEQPPDQVLSSGFELHECREFQDFRKVVTSFGSLEVNWVYSDRQGNIGYQLGSPLPLRSVEDTTTLLDAGDPQTHWQGYWPLEETPHAFNPIQGYLASCNNEMSWDPKLPGFYDPYRIARISTLLEAKDQHSLEDLGDYQLDTVSQRFLRWRTLLENAAFDLGWVSLAKSLKSWDGNMLPDDTRPTLMLYWWRQLQEEVFLDELGADYRLAGTIFERTLSDPTNQWIDDQTTPQKETLEDLAKRALSRLSETQRDTPYHRVFTYAPAHPFARIPLLDWLLPLRRGPLPWPGSGTSLRAAFWEKTDHGFQVVNGPSMRFLLDWQQVDGFLLNLPLGQSGNPFDPHFADFFDAPKRWCVPFSKSAVLAKASSTLKLMPKEKP